MYEELEARIAEADGRLAEADALMDVASTQLCVAARDIAHARDVERAYRRATWHHDQLMRHRVAALPELEPSRRTALAEAIGAQARELLDACVFGTHASTQGRSAALVSPSRAQNSMPRRAGIPAS